MKLVAWWKTRLWWVRWISYAVATVVIFYAVEDFRGYRALERAKAEYLAAGLRLDINEIRGPAIPDEDNFAASEIIREAYADPEDAAGNCFLADDLPERPADTIEVKYHGFRGKERQFSDLETKEKYDQQCREFFRSRSGQLSRYLEAAMRPSCDWRAVTDPTDFEAPTPHLTEHWFDLHHSFL